MKSMRNFSITILTCLFFLAISAKGQEVSTIAEIYDFEVGDIFHTYGDGSINTGEGFNSKSINTIQEKDYSNNGDTLFYLIHHQYAEISSSNPYWIYTDTIITSSFSNLDLSINNGNIDSVYSDSSLYNGRLINKVQYEQGNTYYSLSFVNGCGQAGNYSLYTDEMYIIETSYSLVYYKKGSEEWGTPLNIFTDITKPYQNTDISIFPNPASETISIKFLSNYIVTNPTLELMTLTGNLVKTFNLNNSSTTISIDYLTAGIYLYTIKSGPNVLKRGKLIKQ